MIRREIREGPLSQCQAPATQPSYPSRSWHEPTFKGPFQDGLPQHAAAGEAGSDSGFDLIEDGEAAINLVQDSQLF